MNESPKVSTVMIISALNYLLLIGFGERRENPFLTSSFSLFIFIVASQIAWAVSESYWTCFL